MLKITFINGFRTEAERAQSRAVGQQYVICQDATQLLMPSDLDLVIRRAKRPYQHYVLVPPAPEHTRCTFLPGDGLHYGGVRVENPASGIGVRLGTDTAAPLIGPFSEITIHYGMLIDLIPPADPRSMAQFPAWWPRDRTGRLGSQTVDWDDLTTRLTGWPLSTVRLQLEPWPTADDQP